MIKLIVGLGNPGERYQKTRHNAGFWLLDYLAQRQNCQFHVEKKFQGECSKVIFVSHAVYLLKPLTFMNASGRAVSAMAQFYDIAPDEILIVHDELDLPAGTAKLKFSGGHGGHNGLRDIIAALNTKDFYRLRIGIGHPGVRDQVVDYVLHQPSKIELSQIEQSMIQGTAIFPVLLQDGVEKAMQQLHSAG